MLDLFLYSQISVGIGIALYLACWWLFRRCTWLTLAGGWCFLVGYLIWFAGAHGGYSALFMLWAYYLAGAFCSLFGTFFFYAPNEKHNSGYLAFLTLVPLTILCTLLSVATITHLNLQIWLDHFIPLLIISAVAPNVAAFVVWLYQKHCKPAEKE